MNNMDKKQSCLCLYPNTVMQLLESERKYLEYFCENFLSDFDWILESTECDLKELIELHSPSLIVYTSTFPELSLCDKPVTFPKNYLAYPEIPRIGTLGGDKYSPGIYASYFALKKLGCCVCLGSLVVSGELSFETDEMPIYYRPQLCPGSVFKDYNEEKIIPVGLFGAGFNFGTGQNKHYPWRQKITGKLLNRIPVFHAPRPSNINIIKGSHDIVGENYARMINRCKVALTCGTEQNNILKKHIEIPACKTCLVTEESNLLKACGFIDMENCVFVDENNVCEKLEYLFTNPDVLERITEAGYNHVQESFNTENHFNIYYEIYRLLIVRKPDERIVQDSVSSLRMEPVSNSTTAIIKSGPDIIRKYWVAGFDFLLNDNADKALQEFNKALEYISYCPEALTGIGIILLFSKNLQQAEQTFARSISHIQRQFGLSIEFCDPVEVSYLIVIYLITGRSNNALQILADMQDVKHPALSAVKAIIHNDVSMLSEQKDRKSRIPFDFDDPQKWYNHFKHAISLYSK